MKKRLIHIETRIAKRCLKKQCGLSVLVLVNEADWILPHDLQHYCVYAMGDIPENKNRIVIVSDFRELAFRAESFDMVIMPHILTKAWPLDTILSQVDHILKPEGRVLFFGVNDSKQYAASDIRQALKRNHYKICHYRGYHSLYFLGETVSQQLDFFIGQFFPRLSPAFWLMAKKKILSLKPLKVGWRRAKPVIDTNVQPVAGRACMESDE